MGDVIDFVSRKKLMSLNENNRNQESVKKNSPMAGFEKVNQMNMENLERLKKEREIANKNVIKSYKIK